jgi:hypothetical protein
MACTETRVFACVISVAELKVRIYGRNLVVQIPGNQTQHLRYTTMHETDYLLLVFRCFLPIVGEIDAIDRACRAHDGQLPCLRPIDSR